MSSGAADAQRGPLVTVCVPVRNGAATLERALATIRAQTFRNLEIVLSDNGSTDATLQIMRSFAETDGRARIVSRSPALTALDHFASLIQEASGKYLLFCAADDERSDNYIEVLVEALEASPAAVLAFGGLVVLDGKGGRRPTPFPFDNVGLSAWQRVSKTAFMQNFHFYGVLRTTSFKSIPLQECPYWPDMQAVMAASSLGTFIRDDRAQFLYFENLKSNAERARDQSYRTLSPFFRLGMFTSTTNAMIGAGAGIPLTAWGVTNLAMRELRSAWLVARRKLRAFSPQR